MKKRLIALIACVLILAPGVLQAASANKAEDFTSNNAVISADVQLTGKLKTFLEPLIREGLNQIQDTEENDKARLEVLVNRLLAGDRFFLSVTMPSTLQVSVPVSDEEWTVLTKDFTGSEYNSTPVLQDDETYFTRLGKFAILSSEENVKSAVDLINGTATDSLSNSEKYQNFTSSYLPNHLASLTFDLPALINAYAMASFGGATDEMKALLDLIKMIDLEGFSFAESQTGYKFNMKVTGNKEELQKQGYSFNPGGNFTPALYKKFPNAKPIFYSEWFNPKAEFAQEKKMLENLKLNFGLGKEADIFEIIKAKTGIDLESIYNLLDKEVAFGVQYLNNGSDLFPFITVMANVENTKAAAKGKITELVTILKDFLKAEKVPSKAYKITESGTFTKFTFNITKADKNYDGPPFPQLEFTFGVTDDGLLIISNYPGIETAANRTGFQLSLPSGELGSVFYLNARNVWGWMDNFLGWAERVTEGKNGPPLDFYQGYYSVLEKIYGWEDLLITSHLGENEALVEGNVNIDEAKHSTYEQFLSTYKTADKDGDGVSDYDERYLYNTSTEVSDSDNDGVDDVDELKQGTNPYGQGKLFKDVGEKDYYTDEMAFLYQRGAIKGYSDGTFKPGNLVNRAEFTTMVVQTFEKGTSNYLGFNVELPNYGIPFSDVDKNAWYYNSVAKAYSARFISGSVNQQTGDMIFRPGDNITRAEALAILAKASKTLQKTSKNYLQSKDCGPFKDVSSTDWFCSAVANGYANGITSGKGKGTFKPFDLLTRAEAAVMIRRTLEKDLASFGEGTESVGEMAAPLGKSLLPMF